MVATYAYPATEFILFYLHRENPGFMIFAVIILLIAIANCLFTLKKEKKDDDKKDWYQSFLLFLQMM